jgi:succinate-semialdehyde dehydrogenase/glutarate-semialdehyde dehydrogenase
VDEAITRANDTEYGLNASVWTSSPRFGREVAARIRAGTVNVNEGFAASFGSIDAPMGGFGESGVGRRNGADGIQRFTEVQTIALQRGLKLRPFKGMPAKLWAALLSRGVKVLHQLRR